MQSRSARVYIFLISVIAFSLSVAYYLDVIEAKQTTEWLVVSRVTVAGRCDAFAFSISDGADDRYIDQALASGDAILLKTGTLYRIVEEFPDWYLVELTDRQRLYVAKSKGEDKAEKLIV